MGSIGPITPMGTEKTFRTSTGPARNTPALTIHISKRPKDDDEDQDCRNAASTKFPGCRSGK